MAQMLENKRATRGKRMAQLVGEAAEEDDAFWGNDLWGEGDESDNESYSEEEVEPDLFDSDFNDTEDEGEEEEEEGSDDGKRKQKKVITTSNKPKPAKRSFLRNLDEINGNELPQEPRPKKSKSLASLDSNIISDRAVRQSTKAKTMDSDLNVQKFQDFQKNKKTVRIKQDKIQFKQFDMLKEALETEKENYRWVMSRKVTKKVEQQTVSKIKRSLQKDIIRYHSKKGELDTITYTNIDNLPDLFKRLKPPPIPEKTCVITGLPAKYFDPKTKKPYANLEAFKELRRRYASEPNKI